MTARFSEGNFKEEQLVKLKDLKTTRAKLLLKKEVYCHIKS